jgi:membrane-associated protease RseP (regulator of RpoE activity)
MRQLIPVIAWSLLAGGVAAAESDKDGGDGNDHHFAFQVFAGGRLGVEAVQISKEVRQMLGAPEDGGVLVNGVKSDSVAAEAGIKPGDVIVEVAGQKVKNIGSIRRALADKDAGQTVPGVVIRDKRSLTLNAKLREKSAGHDWGSWMGSEPLDFSDEKSFVFPDGKGVVIRGPRKELDRLSERLNELEKRMQNLESKK